MTLKGRFPFRLGTTSYIIPDDVLPNVRYLADKVDDVELVLFESDEISNIPNTASVRALRDLARDHALTYTVHLPLDAQLGDASEAGRRQSVGKCLRILERMGPLGPFAYVIHFHGDRRGQMPTDNLPRWRENHRRSMEELRPATNGVPMCVETLDYPFGLIEDIVVDGGWNVCLDVGHLLVNGHSVEDHLDRLLPRTRVLHLHGVQDGQDHLDLRWLDPALLQKLLTRLASEKVRERVLTLEIFEEDNFNRSLEVLRRYAPCPR